MLVHQYNQYNITSPECECWWVRPKLTLLHPWKFLRCSCCCCWCLYKLLRRLNLLVVLANDRTQKWNPSLLVLCACLSSQLALEGFCHFHFASSHGWSIGSYTLLLSTCEALYVHRSRSLPAEPYDGLQQNSNFDHCPFCHVGLMETYASDVAALLSSIWIRTGSTSSMYREGTCRIS